MPGIVSRSLIWPVAAGLALWLSLGQGQDASAKLTYNGGWVVNENETGQLTQQYSHRINLNARQDLSDRLTSEEDVNYNNRWEQEGNVTETVSPGAALRLNGDIFFASLAVNSTRQLKTQTTGEPSERLSINWASTWDKSLLPKLTANYDYNRQRGTYLKQNSDGNRQSINSSINWDLRLAQLFYSYTRQEGNFQAYQDWTDSSLARINVNKDWLDNRLRVALGQEYHKSTNGQDILLTTSNTANISLPLSQVYTGTDRTSNLIDDSLLVAAPLLLNDDFLAPAYSVNALGSPNCIRLLINGQQNGQLVDRVFLYTQTRLVAELAGVNFRVYTNDDFLVNPWVQVPLVPWHYDSINQRFVIDLPSIKTNHLKLVVDLTGPDTINFTELRAEQDVHGDLGSTVLRRATNQTDRSNLNLDFRFNRSTALFYSLYINKSKNDGVTTNTQEAHNFGLKMQNSAGDLKSTLSYGLSRGRLLSSPETQSETYQLSVNEEVLPTLSLALSASRDNTSLGGAKVSSRDRFSFYADAKLYPDLTSRLEAVYVDMQSFGAAAAQDNFNTRITFTSRFRPSLNVSVFDYYEVINDKNVNKYGLSANWQVSDLLALYASGNSENSNLGPDPYDYVMGLTAGMGSGFELSVNYSMNAAESTNQSGRVTLRWASLRNVTWEIGFIYAETDIDSARNLYKVFSRFDVNFAAF